MPTYDYRCDTCEKTIEIFHSMSDDSEYLCADCEGALRKMVSGGYIATAYHAQPTRQGHKESEHQKKVKDPERAVKMRKKAFGKDAVGDPSMQTDPRHIVRQGRTIGGGQKEVDKQEFIKAAAKDEYSVKVAQDIVKKKK